MRRWVILSLSVVLVGLLAGAVPVALARPVAPTGYELHFDFAELPQGGVGVIHLDGFKVQGARARFLNRLIDFYPLNGAWHGLLAVNMDQNPGTYPLQVLVWFEDGGNQSWEGEVQVVEGGFIRQDVTIPSELGYLLEPETDRAERARLRSIFNQVTPIHYWDGAFTSPAPGDFTSPFGAYRLYNEVYWGRHTGLDIRGPLGTPIMAAAAGRVALAEWLDVRGNHVIIDHGWGVYTGYAHLSEIHVTRGQVVRQGQVIGVSGNTGRSSGPHIHWEVAVNGEWVDPARFLDAAVP